MAMSITVTMGNGSVIELLAGGKYAPDVMHDLKNRALELMAACIDAEGAEIGDDLE